MSRPLALRGSLAILATLLLVAGISLVPAKVLAACPAQSTTRGEVTASFSVPANGTYRVWSRIKASSSTNNSYILEIDGTTCGVIVGDASIPAGAWTWINYKNGSTTTPVSIALSAGSHTLVMIGREDNVALDKVIFTTDTACVPSGTGDNCASVDVTLPPPDTGGDSGDPGAGNGDGGDTGNPGIDNSDVFTEDVSTDPLTVDSGTDVLVDQPASDLSKAVDDVEYYLDGHLVATVTTAPYSYRVNTAKLKPGKHTLKSIIYYSDGTTKSTTQQITVKRPPFKLTAAETGTGIGMLALAAAGLFVVFRRRGGLRWHGITFVPAKKAAAIPLHDPDAHGIAAPAQSAPASPPAPSSAPRTGNVVVYHPTPDNKSDVSGGKP